MSATDDLAELDRLPGRDLVAELRELERARVRLRVFDGEPNEARATGGTFTRKRGSHVDVETGDAVAHVHRGRLEAACIDAERAVAVLLLELRGRLERRARGERPFHRARSDE